MTKVQIELNLSGITRRTNAVIAKLMTEKKLSEADAILFLVEKAYKPAQG